MVVVVIMEAAIRRRSRILVVFSGYVAETIQLLHQCEMECSVWCPKAAAVLAFCVNVQSVFSRQLLFLRNPFLITGAQEVRIVNALIRSVWFGRNLDNALNNFQTVPLLDQSIMAACQYALETEINFPGWVL